MNGFLANGLLLQVVPALIGAFLGAPVLAREMESGTFRFAWTQGFGRWRWTLAKLVALGVVVAAAAGALSVLFSWYYQPYFAAGNQALFSPSRSRSGRPRSLPACSTCAGSPSPPGRWPPSRSASWPASLIRRVVPAIVATLVAYAGLAFAAGGFLRQHYLTPLVTSSLNVPGSAWIISQQWTKGGRPVSQSVLGQLLQRRHQVTVAGKGGVPEVPHDDGSTSPSTGTRS